jgi:hypothetical protein
MTKTKKISQAIQRASTYNTPRSHAPAWERIDLICITTRRRGKEDTIQ